MKKLLGLFVVGLLFLGQVNAQDGKISTDESMPEEIIQSFDQEFDGAEGVKWSQRNEYFMADFEHGREEKSAWYNQSGELELIQTRIGKDELPRPVCNTLSQDGFANHKFKRVFKLEMQDEVMYKLDARKSGEEVEVLVRDDGKLVDRSDENQPM